MTVKLILPDVTGTQVVVVVVVVVVFIYLFGVGNPTDSPSTSRVPTRGEKRERLL